jgi:hypothetical protein
MVILIRLVESIKIHVEPLIFPVESSFQFQFISICVMFSFFSLVHNILVSSIDDISALGVGLSTIIINYFICSGRVWY